MKRIIALLLALVGFTITRADNLGGAVVLTPHSDWKAADPNEPGQPETPFPTLKYVPKDGRNAAIFLTLMPNDVQGLLVSDLASLKRFNRLSAQPYIADPENPPPVTELKIRNALAVAMTNEDPALIGKPVPPDEYRIATTVSVLLGRKYLIHCTIFYDEKDSTDFRQALEILQSVGVRVEADDRTQTI